MAADPRSPSAAPAKTYPRPDGNPPHALKTCPLCKVPPLVGHIPTCPWMLWAKNPEVTDA